MRIKAFIISRPVVHFLSVKIKIKIMKLHTGPDTRYNNCEIGVVITF